MMTVAEHRSTVHIVVVVMMTVEEHSSTVHMMTVEEHRSTVDMNGWMKVMQSYSAKYFPRAMLSTSHTVLTALEFQPSFSDENQMTNGKC